MLITKKKNAHFGRYPSCDLCNNALRFILEGKNEIALQEIVRAIIEANGYFHEDVAEQLQLKGIINFEGK